MGSSLFGNLFRKAPQPDSKGASEAEEWCDKGDTLYLEKHYEEGIRCYDKALRLAPGMVKAHTGKGNCLENLGRRKEAVKCYTQALKLDPENADAWLNLGISEDKAGNLPGLLNCYEHYLLYAPPEHIKVIFHTTMRLRALGIADIPATLRKIIDEETKAAGLTGGNDHRKVASTWDKRGQSFIRLGYFKDALQYYDKSLTADPGFSQAWNGKGVCLKCLGRENEAIPCFDQALALDPGMVIAWWNKGDCLENMGRFEDAVLCYDQALIYNPSMVRTWLSKGECEEKLGRKQEAVQSYKKMLEIAPLDFKSEIERATSRLEELEKE